MPPKPKKPEGPSKKTENKKKDKIIEDKTFGMKNKKGTKSQKFIKTVEQQVKQGGVSKAKKDRMDTEVDRKAKKEELKKQKDELNALFRPVAQTVPKGVDPKSMICAFYKQGQCGKGDKCKFSHDLAIERKGEKRSAYSDVRDDDTMADWDEAKLEEVVTKKHGESDKAKPKTAIICRYFLDAVENNKYGWFWACPNGNMCIYRHCLPSGFVLKKDLKKEDKGEQISIEELIEKERAALGGGTTKVTLESFLQWKERKRKEKIAALEKDTHEKKKDYKQGKVFGISGRQMFEFNPDLADQDDEEAGEGEIERESSDEDEEPMDVVDIDLDSIRKSAHECDGTGTISKSSDRGDPNRLHNQPNADDESSKLSEAAAFPVTTQEETDAAIAIAMSATMNGDVATDVPIDEDLFEGEDMDDIDEDLETLELNS